MAHVLIYTTPWCPYCHRAKQLLGDKGVAYDEIDVDADPGQRAAMEDRSGRYTVPQIFINGASIGGCDDLYALEHGGKLDGLLAADAPT